MSIINNIINNIGAFLETALYILPVSLISLTIHEYAHGFVAYKLGDPTARNEGRLSFNPFRHFDLIGFIFMLVFKVGYAKPVPVNPLYFRNPKKGMLITAAAGPLSNLLLAIISSFFSVFFFYAYSAKYTQVFYVLFMIFWLMTIINLGLAVFNLIPVHPFDGSRILGYFMPNSYHNFIHKYGNYIYIAFFVLLITTDFISNAISSVQSFLYSVLSMLWDTPCHLIAQMLF